MMFSRIARKKIEERLQYRFKDLRLLKEALVAQGSKPSTKRTDGRKHGNKSLALIGDAVFRLVVVDNGVIKNRPASN